MMAEVSWPERSQMAMSWFLALGSHNPKEQLVPKLVGQMVRVFTAFLDEGIIL